VSTITIEYDVVGTSISGLEATLEKVVQSGLEFTLSPTSSSDSSKQYFSDLLKATNGKSIRFTIESDETVESNRGRVDSLKVLQQELGLEQLKISISVHVSPIGLSPITLSILKSIYESGLVIDTISILAYNYGSQSAPNAGYASASYAIQAATFSYSQIQAIGYSGKLGITVMIGQSDIQTEYFKQTDAQQLVNWAKTAPWVSILAFELERDVEEEKSGITQVPWEFTTIFSKFE
jgi:hypothetical protein